MRVIKRDIEIELGLFSEWEAAGREPEGSFELGFRWRNDVGPVDMVTPRINLQINQNNTLTTGFPRFLFTSQSSRLLQCRDTVVSTF